MPSPLDQPESPTPPHDSADQNESSSSDVINTTTDSTSTSLKPSPLAIELPSAPGSDHQGDETAPMVLNVGGDAAPIKLDKLGPMIINSDGTISRIQNWHELSQIEQERTVRLLVKKRNLVRLQKLEKDEQDAEGGKGKEDRLGLLKDQ